MGGTLTVTSKECCGSTFTFVLPCKVPSKQEDSGDSDEISAIADQQLMPDANSEEINGTFLFKPCALGTQFSSSRSMVRKTKLFQGCNFDPLSSIGASPQESDSLSSVNCIVSESSQTYSELGAPIQSNLDHNIHNAESMKRKDEIFQDDRTSPGSSSMNFRKSQKCDMSSKCGNMTDLNEIGALRPANCRPRQTEENENPLSTTSSNCEQAKIKANPRILLVEDNKINIMVAQSMMKQLGHKIDVVNNGLEAIRAFHHSHYDLILMVIFVISFWFTLKI